MKALIEAAALTVLLGTPAFAQTLGSPTFSNLSVNGTINGNASGMTATATGGTITRTFAARFADVANALDFGADATGVADSTSAIAAALATGRNVWLPKGTYKLTNQITVANGQHLFGDGRGQTTIAIDNSFSASATGVISLTGREQTSPTVRDLAIQFAQPSDQSSRANFKTLAAGGTSATGGTGVQYPPAIIITSSNRFRLSGLRISRAWDGIINASGNNIGGFLIADIEISAFSRGLSLDNVLDFGHVRCFHHWDFDLSTSLQSVSQDGNTYGIVVGAAGQASGLACVDISLWECRFSVANANTWVSVTNLGMDGNNSTLEISDGSWNEFSNVYFTGNATGSDSNAQLTVSGGNNFFSNLSSVNSTLPGVSLSGGLLEIVNGRFSPQTPSQSAVVQSGGTLKITNCYFSVNTGAGAWTVPLVAVTAGNIHFTNNDFNPCVSGVGGVVLTADNANHCITGNLWNGWTLTAPGPLGVYGPNGPSDTSVDFGTTVAGMLTIRGSGNGTSSGVRIQPATAPASTQAMIDYVPPKNVGNSLESKIRLWSTFGTSSDHSPRYTASLRCGQTGGWGTGYVDTYLSNTTNDVGNDSNTVRMTRVTTGGLALGNDTFAATLNLWLDTAAGQARNIVFDTASLHRWVLQVTGTAESGSNAGSDFQISRYSDASSSLGAPLAINRATGLVTLASGVAISGTSTIDGATIGGTTPAAVTGTSIRTGSTAGPTWTTGTGAPSTTQPVSSLYSRTDGTTGSRLYVSAGGGTWNAIAGV